VAGEPGKDSAGVLGAIAVIAGVRGSAHPVVEDAGGRLGGQVQRPAIEEPLAVGHAVRRELLAQGLEPGIVFVDHVDARLGTAAVRHAFAGHRGLPRDLVCRTILAPLTRPVNVIASHSEPCYTPPTDAYARTLPCSYRLGDTRAVMTEGASREALELVEVA
jgi:hypothetical protein